MFRMMRAVPRMASVRQATIKSQTVMSVKHKASISISVMTRTSQSMIYFIISEPTTAPHTKKGCSFT